MGMWRTAGAMALALVMGACSGPPRSVPPPAPPVTDRLPAATEITYPVGVRLVHLRRGPQRPLPTLVFYPAVRPPWATAAGRPTAAVRSGARPGLPPAPGRFPLVLFSHGLTGSPKRYAAILTRWAAAGFVIAAPTYPYTSEFTAHFRRGDIVHQPADAGYVLDRIRALDRRPRDPLRGHIDGDRVAAVGHSAGGYTTSGLFRAGHDPRLRAGVIMAGWRAPGAFAGPPATMLFLQGTADPVVPVAVSRAAYERVPWPKRYVLLRHNSHATYLRPGDPGYRRVSALVIAFLRETLGSGIVATRPPTPSFGK